MSIEYCENCDRHIDTDEYAEGEYRDVEPCGTEYVCEDCCENELIEHESLEAALEDHDRAKRRGEL